MKKAAYGLILIVYLVSLAIPLTVQAAPLREDVTAITFNVLHVSPNPQNGIDNSQGTLTWADSFSQGGCTGIGCSGQQHLSGADIDLKNVCDTETGQCTEKHDIY